MHHDEVQAIVAYFKVLPSCPDFWQDYRVPLEYKSRALLLHQPSPFMPRETV